MEARTQMHYARRGEITDAMRFVAEREEISPELVRDEIAIGRLIIPANIRHLAGEGRWTACSPSHFDRETDNFQEDTRGGSGKL